MRKFFARRGRVGDEGATSVLILMSIPVLVAALGLVMDVGGKLDLENQVQWTAEQAARTAGQQIQGSAAQQGASPGTVDVERARAAAMQIVSSSGMTGTVVVTGGQIEVTVNAAYDAKILPVSSSVTGHATAALSYGVGADQSGG